MAARMALALARWSAGARGARAGRRSRPMAATGAGAGVADLGVAGARPPRPRREPRAVRFGRVEGENRGADGAALFDPPRERTDDLFWLRDDKREDEEVLAHLRQENAYFASEAEGALKPYHDTLYAETKALLKETDVDAPVPRGDWEYYARTVEGKSYRIRCRRPRGGEGSEGEEVLLDENVLAAASKHCEVGAVAISPSQNLMAYSVDRTGYETYTVHFRDLRTGEEHADVLEGEVDSGIVWGPDDTCVFYTTMDDQHRPFKLWRHTLGTPQADDELLVEESDELFWMGFFKSRSGRFLFCQVEAKETGEMRVIDLHARTPEERAPRLLAPREEGVLVEAEHLGGDTLAILTTADDAINFKLQTAPVPPVGGAEDRSAWSDVASLPYAGERNLISLEPFENALLVEGRRAGYTRVWRMDVEDGQVVSPPKEVEFEAEACECGVGSNLEFATGTVRLHYSSLVTPAQDIDLSLATGEMAVVKEKEVPGYDPSQYEVSFETCVARDGTEVPISLVHRKGARGADGKTPAPMLLYGYGSYGICIDPSFDYKVVPLLDRGMVFAIAHIRGGGELGRPWYKEQGKFLTKLNTFTDFVDCAQHLVDNKWTRSEVLAINGRSAGGLLMGSVINMAPSLFRCCVAGVPFVDVMTTMCDASIPLTIGEWDEWGNPNAPQYHDYMLSYSPMENIQEDASDYPTVFITAGLNDPRVAYWEPAKWAVRLRDAGARVLAKFDLDSGHFSASDRYKYISERAWDYAVVLRELGLPPEK